MYMNALIAAAILGYAAAAPTNAAESLDLQARDAEAIVLRPGMHPIPVPKLPNGRPRFSIKVAERDAEPEAFRLLPGEHPIETPELPNGLHISMKNKLPRDAEAADEALLNHRPLGHGPVVFPGRSPALRPGRLPLGHGPVVLPNHPTIHPLENRDADAADEAQVNRFRGHGPVVHPGIGPAVPLRGPGRLPHGHGPVVHPGNPTIHPLENRDAAAPAAPSKPNTLFPKLKGKPRRFCDGCSVQMFQEKHFENNLPFNQEIAQRDVEDDVEARDAEEELEAREEALVKTPTNSGKGNPFIPSPLNRFPHMTRPIHPLENPLHNMPIAGAQGQQAQPKVRDVDEELETREFDDEELEARDVDVDTELEAREPIVKQPTIPKPNNKPQPKKPWNLNNYLRNRPCDGCVHTMYTDNPGLFNELHGEPVNEAKGQGKQARDAAPEEVDELEARDDGVVAANAQLADFVAGHA